MLIEDFQSKLQQEPEEYLWTKRTGFYTVASKRWETEWEISVEAIEANEWQTFLELFKGGKDIEHITRVTGYFTKVSGWNVGKKQELKDRFTGGRV